MTHSAIQINDLNVNIGDYHVIKDLTCEFRFKKVTAIMGPSGCGKTTLIRCLNRMNELVPDARVTGAIHVFKKNIYEMDPFLVRRKVGMVFQRPNPFPTMTIFENVISGYTLNGIRVPKSEKERIVEIALKKAALWEEVKDFLHRKGTFLSGGQQQRLCIARALAMNPKVLLLDEPTSALDPKSTARIEELMMELKETVTLVLVTHNMAQANRVSDDVAFLYMGELVELGATQDMFSAPKDPRTQDYLNGKFG